MPALADDRRIFPRCPPCMQACSFGFDSCILASPNIDPTVLLRRVMPLLAPSASFAVFSNWMQPLADCMFKLQVTCIHISTVNCLCSSSCRTSSNSKDWAQNVRVLRCAERLLSHRCQKCLCAFNRRYQYACRCRRKRWRCSCRRAGGVSTRFCREGHTLR